ncbi:MAG: prephenate dehydrogenase [Buchananella hordeovulneris]|nr:prephenate dehydrogenase [Buchananella hordeovulneris]
MSAKLTQGPVLIIGTGLLGASLGLALRPEVEVYLRDSSPAGAALARDVGAGCTDWDGLPAPRLVVVATPPDVVAEVVAGALSEFPAAVVTDVASIKADVETEVLMLAGPEAATRYVGSHPMAGRERTGALAADGSLFLGRPWVVVPHAGSSDAAVNAVRSLAVDAGGVLHQLSAREHDAAVALVSHVPQVVSSLLAGRLVDAPAGALDLAGQGLRDVTRIAASSERMWTAILTQNSAPVRSVLAQLQVELSGVIEALAAAEQAGPEAPGVHGTLGALLRGGNEGVARIPGKHGGAGTRFGRLTVLISDEPGQLGQLFTDAGEAGISIEDVTIEHARGKRMGMVELSVLPAQLSHLSNELTRRGWRIVESEI